MIAVPLLAAAALSSIVVFRPEHSSGVGCFVVGGFAAVMSQRCRATNKLFGHWQEKPCLRFGAVSAPSVQGGAACCIFQRLAR